MRLLRNFIANHDPPGGQIKYDIKNNFTSRETFEHMLISVQSALLKIRQARIRGAEVWL